MQRERCIIYNRDLSDLRNVSKPVDSFPQWLILAPRAFDPFYLEQICDRIRVKMLRNRTTVQMLVMRAGAKEIFNRSTAIDMQL